MKSGKLTVKRLPIARFFMMYQDADIPVGHAINSYLKHSGGMTEAVTKELTVMQECFEEYSA
jgi:hypothetical protein